MGNGLLARRRGPALCLALVLLAVPPAWAAGFGIFTQGASALGQADAVVAHGDDPSAVFFNPALLHKLPGTQVQLGSTLIAPVREFESAGGGTTRGDADLFFPSTAYLTHRLHETLAVGLGVFSPFGLGTAWPGDWEGRTLATRSEVTTFQLNPVLCLRPLPGLSVALGLDALYLDASLKRKVNTAALGTVLGVPGAAALPDADQEFSGDGWGLGVNAGLHADLTDRLAVGLTYRGAIRVKAEGQIRHETPAALGPLLPDTGAQASIDLPAQATAGLSYRLAKRLVGEVGVRWEGWSAYDALAIEFDDPVLGQARIVDRKDWRDTFAYLAGLRYGVNDSLDLLAGYLFGETAVPDSTLDPAIPDAPSHLVTVGAEAALGRTSVALAYGYQWLVGRTKDNAVGDPVTGLPVANGDYDSRLHLVGLSLTRRF